MQITSIPSICILGGLVACANPPGAQEHGMHHMQQPSDTGNASRAQGGMTGSAATGSGMMAAPPEAPHGHKKMMCDRFRSMRDAPDAQAREAMMDRQMQGMSPEMRQQHMEMMRQRCQ